MTTRNIQELANEIERESTECLRKMKLLTEYYLKGVREIDDETWEPVIPDNVLLFKGERQ